ncbi:hypothetical protein [Roseomonas indoligenes]|uniref:Glycine-rich domain-containing protein n=1 Tax=Roseomonas indoligenes TaxID=2820811 RepID=A0A940MQI1_9PROT|nr:hypothetical protein [Pararoseomonas indoligenes]MBP0492153.1 hypothetical protein [Pararoseomonas indoligenes]
MRRLANGTQVNSLPAPAAAVGSPGYGTNGNPGAGQEASIFDADQYNIIQEEIAGVIEDVGIALDATGTNRAQLKQALLGRLINVQIFKASATFTPTTGARRWEVEGVGGGGAGGGGVNQAVGSYQASPGGAAGTWGRRTITGITGPVVVTVGLGGVGVAGAQGGSGGTTSFGPYLSMPGGTGASIGSAKSSGVALAGDTPSPADASGADISFRGQAGGGSIISSGDGIRGGTGGSTPYGSGGVGRTSPTGGGTVFVQEAGKGYGAGGGGSYGDTQPSSPGASGASGIIIVREYA